MSAPGKQVERLDLKFRAAPTRSSVPGGWLIWCLAGMAIGVGAWWLAQDFLTYRLGQQLSSSTPAEAMVALEGLLALDEEAALEVVAGLQHSDRQVARTAFRALEAQITRWQERGSGMDADRLQTLARRLSELPASTPEDNLVLASSLASRIFTACLHRDDPELGPTIALCEAVFERVGRGRLAEPPGVSDAEVSQAPSASLLSPPPPLDNQTASRPPAVPDPQTIQPAAGDSNAATASLSDTSTDPPAVLPPTGMVASVSAREAVHRSTGTPAANIGFVTPMGQPLPLRPLAPDRETVHLSLSDNTSATPDETYPDSPLRPAPATSDFGLPATPDRSAAVLIHQTPARVSDPPVVMRKLTVDDALADIEERTIDELVRLLASPEPRVAQAAALQLRVQGLSDERLTLASELATGSEADRLEMLGRIAVRADLDPRPWLLWMAEEGQPAVRRRAVSLLSSMTDLNVEQELRRILSREGDEDVARAIRQILRHRS